MMRRSYFWQLTVVAAAILVLAAALVGAAGSALAQGAMLTTDKPDYAPGETAILVGAGFAPGEPIDLSIAIQDPDTGLWIPDWDWTGGYADDQGGFVADYLVPDIAADMNLVAHALGLTSGL